jgi:diadenosine tetraphosphatase ApaH/serine/threonine PP2A family protein phosphatase
VQSEIWLEIPIQFLFHTSIEHSTKNLFVPSGLQVYYQFLLAFQAMPLAAVVDTPYGCFFGCHGGISPSLETLDDISEIDRFVEPGKFFFLFFSIIDNLKEN